MGSFSVSARGLNAVQVDGQNWIEALGLGLAALGRDGNVQRLACEVLQNGTVIARDITTGTGFIVQEVGAADEEFEELEEIDMEELDLEELPVDATDEEGEFERAEETIEDADTPRVACQLALQAARDWVQAESGAVILDERGYLRFAAVSGPHARKLAGVRLPLGTGVAGFSMEKQQVVVLADAHEDPRHCGEVDALTGYVTRQIAVLPITADSMIFGVIELMNLRGRNRFSDEDIENLSRVADALGRRLAR